jgi:hypothetical protein
MSSSSDSGWWVSGADSRGNWREMAGQGGMGCLGCPRPLAPVDRRLRVVVRVRPLGAQGRFSREVAGDRGKSWERAGGLRRPRPVSAADRLTSSRGSAPASRRARRVLAGYGGMWRDVAGWGALVVVVLRFRLIVRLRLPATIPARLASCRFSTQRPQRNAEENKENRIIPAGAGKGVRSRARAGDPGLGPGEAATVGFLLTSIE